MTKEHRIEGTPPVEAVAGGAAEYLAEVALLSRTTAQMRGLSGPTDRTLQQTILQVADSLAGGRATAPEGTASRQARMLARELSLERAEQAMELGRLLSARVAVLVRDKSLEMIERRYGGVLGRLIALLGTSAFRTNTPKDELAKLLAQDPRARAEATTTTPQSNPELFETLLLALTTPSVLAFLLKSRGAVGTESGGKAGRVPRVDSESQKVKKSDGEEDPRAVLARRLAERAQFVIPILAAARETTSNASPASFEEEDVEPVKRVSRIRTVKRRRR